MSLHQDEVAVDADLVSALLVEQMPHLAHLRPVEVDTAGSVNAVHRLGEHLCTRLPRAQRFVPDLEREERWLAHLAPHLPLAVPEVVATGRPGCGYPYPWALYRWVDGILYDRALVADQERAGGDLAAFVRALRAQPLVPDAPPAGRAPLAELAEETREALARCAPELGQHGVEAALVVWESALLAPAWDGRAVWAHADLLPFNLTTVDGALHGVIDFGAVGVGDDAADVVAAWALFNPAGRAAYRRGLDVKEGTWARARGYALHEAANIVWYYRHTHPAFAASAIDTITQVLDDQH